MTKKWLALLLTLVLLCSMSTAACAADYIQSIAVGSGLSKFIAKDDLEYCLNSDKSILIDKDLNDGAGGKYIYMGYTYSPSTYDPITGILFYETDSSESPPESRVYKDVSFDLLGGKIENNDHRSNHEVDLNEFAGGKYIYTYITRDPDYGPALTEISVGSKTDSYVIRNFDGEPQDLNAGCDKLIGSVPKIYLCAKPFDSTVYARYHYLTENGLLVMGVEKKQLNHHDDALTALPAVPSSVSYAGYTLTFTGWTRDTQEYYPESVCVAEGEGTSPSPKPFYAVYACTPTLTYHANGGSSTPNAQQMTIFRLNAMGKQTAQQNFTITSEIPKHKNPCYEFLGWSSDPNATQPQYTAGQSVRFDTNTTLYAVWQDHHYGTLIPAQPATHTKDTLKPGMSAYYQCSTCMGYFTESKTPTTIYDLIGETPAHTFENSVCTECGYVILLTGTRSHVVTYDANGGTGAMEPQLFSAGVAQKLTPNAFNRPGYTFIGWNTAADGSGTSYRADTNFTAVRSITLYAQWQAIEGWVAPSTANLPKTGDSSAPLLWLAMSSLSMMGILLLKKKAYDR